MDDRLKALLNEVDRLHQVSELSKSLPEYYFEPGKMENFDHLDKTDGYYNITSGEIVIRFEVKGTRYDGRSEMIEQIEEGDKIEIIREKDNNYNFNNFTFVYRNNRNVGNMPAELCNVIAPLYDEGKLIIDNVVVSYVEPLSKRNRHAKQALLFLEVRMIVLK